MVYLIKKINEIKEKLFDGKFSLNEALYNFINNQPNIYNKNLFNEIDDLCYKGYCGLKNNTEILHKIYNESRINKVGYLDNILHFIGLNLSAEDGPHIEIQRNYSKFGIREQYIISLCFPEECEINPSSKSKSIYEKLIFFLISNTKISDEELEKLIGDVLLENNNDVIELILLEKLYRKSINIEETKKGTLEILENILNNFSNSIKKITTSRYNNRQGIIINDEYDVQDILYTILKCYFPNIDAENPSGKLGGKSSRIDFVLKDLGIFLEVKMLKESESNENRIIEELKLDIIEYSKNEVKELIMFVYDPYKKFKDINNLKELEGKNSYENQSYTASFNIHTIYSC